MRFTKMQGAGNDYVYVDCFSETAPSDPAELARRVSDRHFGVGADGLVLIGPSDKADAEMRMFNADGSASQMCGNAVRCVAKYLYDHGRCTKETLTVESFGETYPLDLVVEGGKVTRVRVDMGEPILDPAKVPTRLKANQEGAVCDADLTIGDRLLKVTAVSMGNPHCVEFVPELPEPGAPHDLVVNYGPHLENHEMFPERVNAEFVELISPTRVRQRTWERGSGETLACGTGASAVCVAGVLSGRTERKITVELLGGELELEWNESDNRVYKTGPAVEVFTGEWPE
ncbi:Diaminopimelate epimerase [Pseudobythopirellula maris]|uniref:Diaminopimelate epimerase n=1 Tax=Pseudobythopirellula maris TaxID=2527991 RepID=A0A5C5ZJB7_9BACT|nr:diaminopimelate epimerase [Pseudobythopirellula maris]TWT86911.1 Diaminopimelate epimerase [Pseudobythopirellula maris]